MSTVGVPPHPIPPSLFALVPYLGGFHYFCIFTPPFQILRASGFFPGDVDVILTLVLLEEGEAGIPQDTCPQICVLMAGKMGEMVLGLIGKTQDFPISVSHLPEQVLMPVELRLWAIIGKPYSLMLCFRCVHHSHQRTRVQWNEDLFPFLSSVLNPVFLLDSSR